MPDINTIKLTSLHFEFQRLQLLRQKKYLNMVVITNKTVQCKIVNLLTLRPTGRGVWWPAASLSSLVNTIS